MAEFFRVAFTVITPIFVTAGLGFWFGRRFKPDPSTISRLAIYIFLPALVFRGIAESNLPPSAIGQVFVLAFSISISITVVASLVVRFFKPVPDKTRSAFVVSAMMANAGNYGLPFIEFAFGSAGIPVSIIVFIASSISNYTLGIYVASSGDATLRQGIMNVLRVPLPYAAALGLAFNLTQVTLPLPIMRAVDLLANAAVPLMILLLGIQLSRINVQGYLRSVIAPVSLSATLRLLVTPLICMLLAALYGVTGLPRNVVLVQMSMPTAVTAALLATEFGSDVQYVTATILITTLASLLTLSLIMTILVV